MTARPEHRRYAWLAYRSAPITFVRRVVLGRDPYWRRYFWARWGFPDRATRACAHGRAPLWLDALSGGEITQMVTFCRMLRAELPGVPIVVSTNNRYSYEFATRHLDVDAVFDTPWDCSGPVRRTLDRIAPRAVVAVQNVTSPLLFLEAARRRIPTLLVSGLMNADAPRHPMFTRTMEWNPFATLTRIGARSDDDARAFIAVGARPETISITGNMKFDLDYLAVPDAERVRLARELGLTSGAPVFLAASIHPGEDDAIVDGWLSARRSAPSLRLVLVPRYAADAGTMTGRLDARGIRWARRSRCAAPPGQDTVIVVDTFGELSRLYAVASIIFVGGSLYRRNAVGFGQNLVEPLVQARPILFGPYMSLWHEITESLRKTWPGVEVVGADGIGAALTALTSDAELSARLGATAAAIAERHRDDVRVNVALVVRELTRAAA